MFVRVKGRRRKSGAVVGYAYLVKSKWLRGGPRQRIVAYLGRVVDGGRRSGDEGIKVDAASLSFQEVVRRMVSAELNDQGFREGLKGVFERGGVVVDVNVGEVRTGGRKVVLQWGDGFLCGETLQKVLSYQPPVGNELVVGRDLANWLLLCGLKPDRGLFLGLLKKVLSDPTMPRNAPR